MRVSLFKDRAWIFKSGIDTAWRQQRVALGLVGVDATPEFDPSADVVHINWYSPVSWLVLERARRRGQKVVVFAHTGNDVHGTVGGPMAVENSIKRYISRFYQSGDVLVAVSEYLKDTLERPPFSVTKPIHVIHNGVDRERFTFTEEARAEARARSRAKGPVVACSAQVIPRKGVADFLEVARLMPSCTFHWYGPLAASWLSNGLQMSRMINLRPPNVEFHGFVKDINTVLCGADVFFFPSYEENQSIAILEAASLGLPIVARPIPSYRGWFADRTPAPALFAESPEGFARAIATILDSTSVRDSLVAGAKSVAAENDLRIIGRQFLDLYNGSAPSPR